RYWFSTNSSPMIPVSRANMWMPWAVAPHTHTLTSLEEFPPRTGRFWARATRRPCRAAAIAAHTPARPPPTIMMSAWTVSVLIERSFLPGGGVVGIRRARRVVGGGLEDASVDGAAGGVRGAGLGDQHPQEAGREDVADAPGVVLGPDGGVADPRVQRQLRLGGEGRGLVAVQGDRGGTGRSGVAQQLERLRVPARAAEHHDGVPRGERGGDQPQRGGARVVEPGRDPDAQQPHLQLAQ